MLSRHKKKIESLKSEIQTLRATVHPQKTRYSEEVIRMFGHHFNSIKMLEMKIKDDFSVALSCSERKVEEQNKTIENLTDDKKKLQCKVSDLEQEVCRLRKFTKANVKAVQDKFSPY